MFKRTILAASLAVGFAAFVFTSFSIAQPAQKVPPIPNMAGKIMTVTGPIKPEQLGRTLMHEHLLIDFTLPDNEPERWKLANRKMPVSATDVDFYKSPLKLSMLSDVVHGKLNRDNYLLNDEALAIKEAGDFKRHGGATIVDVTSIGINRDPQALRRIAQASKLNVVMGASWYTKGWHPKDMDTRNVESLTDEIVRDVTVGVGNTGIRAGIIGEVGTTGNPHTPNEIKVIRASARASRLTGAAISLHTAATLRQQPGILDMLAEEGADLSRVVVGHLDGVANDLPFLTELLKRGVYIEFDVLGRPPLINRTRPTDAEIANTIVALWKAGYGERIVLSHDICTKAALQAYGGTGFSYIEKMFNPYLKQLGMSDAQINTMVVDNPKRILTFVAPQAAKS